MFILPSSLLAWLLGPNDLQIWLPFLGHSFWWSVLSTHGDCSGPGHTRDTQTNESRDLGSQEAPNSAADPEMPSGMPFSEGRRGGSQLR